MPNMKCKIITTLICLICYVGFCKAENHLQLSNSSGHPGDTVELALSMSNSDDVVALQAMIPLHGQLTYVPNSCAMTSRGNAHYVTASVLNDTLRIYSYSMSLTPYNGNSGALLTFKVILKQEPATYSLPLCNVLLSSATGNSLDVSTTAGNVTILAPKIALSTQNIDYGHVPIRSIYTRSVTVSNIGNEPLQLSGITFSDNALSTSATGQTIAAGSQTSFTIQYAPLLAGATTYQAIVHSSANVGDSVISIAADPFSVNELRPLSVSGETDSVITISLRMNNMDSIVGLQTNIILPNALTFVPNSFEVSEERSQGHAATAGMRGDTLVLLITSLENRPLQGGDGVVATFQVQLHGYGSYTLRLLQTILSDAAGQNLLSAVYTSSVRIYSPSLSCANSLNLGSTSVTETAQAEFTINNHGDAALLINQVIFTNPNFALATSLPLTIPSWQSANLEIEYNGTQEGTHTTTMSIYSNDPNRPLVQIPLTAERYEPNYLSVSADPNQSVTAPSVNIDLDNYSSITALQMDVVFPKQHYTMTSDDISLTNRSNGHLVTTAVQNDSTLRVLLLSMQNQPLNGNNGTVMRLNLHPVDTNDAGEYPFRLRNVITGGVDGVDRLSGWDSVVYIATLIVHDTTYIPVHDTTYIPVHDTTYIPVHDTTYVPVHDTTYITLYDTTYIIQIDTTYIPVHDTTYITQFDTIYIPVHDTTYITQIDTVVQWQFDTTYVTLYDTTYIPVHDTTYITLYDTTYITQIDTVVQWQFDTTYVTLYDTTYILVHDTTYITLYDTIVVTEPLIYYHLQLLSDDPSKGIVVGSGQFPEGTAVEIAAIPLEGCQFLLWSDGSTENPRTINVTNDILLTAQFTTTGVEGYDAPNWHVFAGQGSLTVKGAGGHNVCVYDVAGKLLYRFTNAPDTLYLPVAVAGTYLVRVDNGTTRKVTVVSF